MRILRLRKISGWTTTGVPIIIGFVSAIVIPVLLAILAGMGVLRIGWGLLMVIQAAVAIGGIALSIPVYQLMMAKSPTLDLMLDGPELTLSRNSRKKKPVARIDLSKPHRCAALVVLDLPAVKVFIAQGKTEISFEQNILPPERLLFLPLCLATRKNSFYGDSAYEFLPAGWRPGVSVQAGDLAEFLFAVAEFSNNNELVPLIAQRKG